MGLVWPGECAQLELELWLERRLGLVSRLGLWPPKLWRSPNVPPPVWPSRPRKPRPLPRQWRSSPPRRWCSGLAQALAPGQPEEAIIQSGISPISHHISFPAPDLGPWERAEGMEHNVEDGGSFLLKANAARRRKTFSPIIFVT